MHAPDKRAVVWSLAIAASLVFTGPVHGRSPKHGSAPRRRAGAVVKAASVPENSIAPGVSVPVMPATQETTSQIMDRDLREPQMLLPDSEPRELKYPDRRGLPQNPQSPLATNENPPNGAIAAGSIASQSLRATPSVAQTIGTSFTGATLLGVNPVSAFPPDTMGVVGPSQFVVAV